MKPTLINREEEIEALISELPDTPMKTVLMSSLDATLAGEGPNVSFSAAQQIFVGQGNGKICISDRELIARICKELDELADDAITDSSLPCLSASPSISKVDQLRLKAGRPAGGSLAGPLPVELTANN